MAKPMPLQDPIATDFVERILEDWNGDLDISPEALTSLGGSRWDIADLLSVMEDGVITSLEKESPYETFFELNGLLDDGTSLSVTFAFDPHLGDPMIVGFSSP